MTHSMPDKSAIAVQTLMTAFGEAVGRHEATWPQAIEAGINILIISMRGALLEMEEEKDEAAKAPAKVDALLHAFSTQLRDLVDLTLAQNGGDA